MQWEFGDLSVLMNILVFVLGLGQDSFVAGTVIICFNRNNLNCKLVCCVCGWVTVPGAHGSPGLG